MKKNLIVLMTAAAMLSSTAAFAETTQSTPAAATPAPTEAVAIDNSQNESEAPAITPSYISNTVTVTGTEEGRISTVTETEEKPENEMDNVINFNVSDDTLVYDKLGNKKSLSDIKKDDKITVFTGSYEPAVLMLPPQYTANVIIIESETVSFVDVDTYLADTDTLTNAANTLSLNTDKDTKIVDKEDKAVENPVLENKDLIVFYTTSTRSIPAQTAPEKIVVLGENELALSHIEAAKNEADATPAPTATAAPEATQTPEEDIPVDFSNIKMVKVGDKEITNIYTKEDGNLMLPLREIVESFGMSVAWDGDLRAVMINDGMYSLQIGVNQYGKGKMMPAALSVAPEITNDLTYVPVDYFMDIIESTIDIHETTTMVISQ